MNEHPAPPRRRIVVLRSTTDIFKQTTSIFSTRNNLLMFLFLSFILLLQRRNIEQATHSLTSYIDNEPSMTYSAATTTRRRRRHRPFHQLTRGRALDGDFFAGDDDLDHRFFGNLPKPKLNSTSFILDSFDPKLGFFNSVSGNGIRESETVRSGTKMTFKSIDVIEQEKNVVFNEIKTAESKSDSHDFTASLYPIGVFSISYGCSIVGFLVTQSFVHGVIFVLVLNDFCKRYNSFVTTCLNGCSLGLNRSFGFIIMRWLIRYTFTVLLGAWFFREIEDRNSVLKIFVRLMFLPYSIFTPWVKEFEKEIGSFIITWLILDIVLSFALTMDVWVVMADSRKNEREVVMEGFYLLSLMILPAFILKSYEGLVCGPYARWLLARIFGNIFAMAFQAFMEVYFLVAWMVYYLSVKSIDANLKGQPFGQRELEAMLKGVK